MDRLEAMSLLLAVTEKGSFSAASRALDVPLPTVSRKVAELESALGTRLLVRSTRRLSLTTAGLAYVVAARRILEQVEEAEREAAGEFNAPTGELTLSAPVMFGVLYVLPIVTDFLAAFPDIYIRLLLADRNVDLIGDHVDMAVRIGRLPDSSMIATACGVMRTVTVASPALLAAHGSPQEPAELRRLPCVSLDLPMPAPAWRYHRPRNGAPLDVAVRPRLTVTTAEGARQAAVRGVGVTRLLHYQVAEALARGELELLLVPYEPAPVPVQLIHAAAGLMPLKMRRFLDFAADRLRRAVAQVDARE